jgi:hypothetical protein
VIAFLRSLFIDAKPYMTQAEARARMAKLMADSTPPKRVEGMEWAERDKDHPACTHEWSDNDAIALEIAEEREAARHVNVFPIQRLRATR